MSSQINSTIVSQIYKSRNILLEQLEERGYDVSNYSGFSINEIHIMLINKQLDMLVENSEGHKIYIKYHLGKTLRKENIYNAVEELFNMEMILNKETDQLLIITKDEPNDTLTKTLSYIWNNDNVFVSLYYIKRLMFNILKHKLVPKHIILSEAEEKEVIEKYNIFNPKTQLPVISRFDPVAIAIGLRPNKICKIIRSSKTAMESIYYRICVD